ncbi:unnamed protein product, partial [Rotaria magnacalcarata]
QHECCDGSVRVFNLDKQTFIKQFNMINISNNIETASLLVTNLINSSPCPCHTLFIVTYINGQLSNCLTFDVCIKQEKQKRFSSELISFNFKLFIKNAICSLVWNPIEHHLFTCSTMPNQNSQSLYIHNSGELSKSVCTLAEHPFSAHIQYLVVVVFLFNLKTYSSASSNGFPLFEFINEKARDFAWLTSVVEAVALAVTIEF